MRSTIMRTPAHLVIASQARLPVAVSEKAEIVAFRHVADAAEHVALIIGTPDGKPVHGSVIHSECLTGDALGSQQMRLRRRSSTSALRSIAACEGRGVVLYLRQEGRGIGLINKVRAYAPAGRRRFDTVDANHESGLPGRRARASPIASPDAGAARAAVSLRLMTNNPQKVAGLEDAGIEVVERVAHKMGENPHNSAYLATKRDRTGHVL
jgi:GTP cyclohydrolase II